MQDQDLWQWALPRSEEVNAAIGSHARDFAVWDALAERTPDDLAREGEPILRAQRIEILRALTTAHPIAVGDRRVEAVNALQNRSHLGHELAKRAAFGHPIGLVYRVTGRTVDASIYSIGDVDVSAIARRYGGGGHRNASGFSVPLRRLARGVLLGGQTRRLPTLAARFPVRVAAHSSGVNVRIASAWISLFISAASTP